MIFRIKIIVLVFLFIGPAYVNACVCVSEEEDISAIYEEAKNIYLVAISGVSEGDNTPGKHEVDLELSVLKVFKGEPVSRVKAIGYGRLPKVNEKGEVVELETSCDMKYVFGSQYIVVEYTGKEIVLAQCSDNVIDMENWESLVRLNRREINSN